jgi:hypothetical protein
MVIPTAFLTPAMLVFIPPLVSLVATALPRGVQFASLGICFPAVKSVLLNGFEQLMLGMHDVPLALVGTFCMKARRYGEEETHCQNGH